jgi:hypothetical protein
MRSEIAGNPWGQCISALWLAIGGGPVCYRFDFIAWWTGLQRNGDSNPVLSTVNFYRDRQPSVGLSGDGGF